jgi:hypothetical protein
MRRGRALRWAVFNDNQLGVSIMPWQDDFFEVDLNQVPMPQIDPSWDSSKAYPREQVDQWVSELEEIQRRTQSQGWRSEDFEQLRDSADPAERNLGETYHKFYHHGSGGPRMNHDFVKLDWAGDHYEITNGQHRIWLAKQRGLHTMPAQVSAPDQPTMDRLRKDSERSANPTQDAGSARKPIWERQVPGTPERDSGRQR